MVSTQPAESCNATIRGFLSHGMSLIDFFPHFERMLSSRREAEKLEEFKARNTQPYVALKYSDVIKKAAFVYTPKIFAMFQEQFARIQEYDLRPGKCKGYGCFAEFRPPCVLVLKRPEALYMYIDVVSNNIIGRVDLGMDALAALFGQGMVLTVPPDNNLLLCAWGDSNGGRGMAPPSHTPAAPTDIAVKFPKQPNPNKNTLRYKTDSEIYWRRASKKWKQSDARSAAAAATVPISVQPYCSCGVNVKLRLNADDNPQHEYFMNCPSYHRGCNSHMWCKLKEGEDDFVVLFHDIQVQTAHLEHGIRRMKAENKKFEARLQHINIDEIEYAYTMSSSL
ncbi:hypothetical protein LINGRAHAP2_LOCUS14626 [Linum grandiflorum]